MAVPPLKGFTPLKTQHCLTGSMRHIYLFHGHPVSEDMLLGLGAGVGFVYWHTKGGPPMLGGRGNVGRPGENGLEVDAGQHTGVRVERHTTGSPRRAEAALLDLLESGEPVMLKVDMGMLPYLSLPEGYQFGDHAVVVAECDPASSTLLVADRDGELHRLTKEALARARGSKARPFPPRNTWYTFDFSARRPPRSEEVRQAIREVVARMLEPPIANLGVRGIRAAGLRVLDWPSLMDHAGLRESCLNAFSFIDARGGTGGGCFRAMYSRFLSEAAELPHLAGLSESAADLRKTGDAWQEVALRFRRASRAAAPDHYLAEISAGLARLAEREEAAWVALGLRIGAQRGGRP